VTAIRLLEGLGSILLFLLPGVGLSAILLGPGIRGAFRLALSYLLGLVWVAGGLYTASHVFSIPIRRTTILALIALPLLALAATWRKREKEAPRPRRRPGWMVAASVVGGLVASGVLADALTNPVTDWDGVMTWATQAKFVRAARSVDAPVFRDTSFFISHPRYPLLMPLAQVAVLETWNSIDDRVFRPLYAAFLPVALALVYAVGGLVAGRRVGSCAVLAAAILPFLATANGGAAGCYSDLPVACFGGAAVVLLLRKTVSPGEAVAAGLLLSGAILSKNEGAFFAAAILAAALLARQRRDSRRVAASLLLALAAVALFVSWRSGMSPRFDENYGAVLREPGLWRRVPGRLASVVPVLFGEMGKSAVWGWFFFGIPLVLVAGWRGIRRSTVVSLALAALGPVAVGCGAYAIHFDPPTLAASTWSRFLIQASIPLSGILAACVREAARERAPRTPVTPIREAA
jgi:hypothetical protein